MMHCTNCGQPLESGAKFCAHCGTQTSAAPKPEQPMRFELPAAPGQVQGATAPARKNFLVIGLGAVFAVAVLGGVGFWGWSNKVASDQQARQIEQLTGQAARAEQDKAARAAEGEARRQEQEKVALQASEKAAIAEAYAALDRAIAAEEAQAQRNPAARK